MFYLWLFLSGLFSMVFMGQLINIGSSIAFNFNNLILILGLSLMSYGLVYRRFKSPHKISYSLSAVGLWIAYYGLFMICTFNRIDDRTYQLSRLLIGALLVTGGALIHIYNKKTKAKKAIEEPNIKALEDTKEKEDKIFETVFEIELILSNDGIASNEVFTKNLKEIENLLLEIQENNYYVSRSLVIQMAGIYEAYNKLYTEKIITPEIIETMINIEEITPKIKDALYIVYNKEKSHEIDKINFDIKALEQQLYLNGLVKSDFQKEE